MKLSQARAQACVDYIVSKGISDTRIFAKGYGKRKPVAPNSLPNGKDNPEGRQLNRRTEFTVLKAE
jgi:OmpA-OmpF porin, OOP family